MSQLYLGSARWTPAASMSRNFPIKTSDYFNHRCGNNYGWSRFEGSRCQVAQIERDGTCVGADRTGFTFPYFEYCHPGYLDDAAGEEALRGGVDICGDKRLTGNAVIGEWLCVPL